MNKDLVSIVVITYNAEAYVIETLESAYRQSYASIELIIADDGSSDATVNLCRSWLDEHAHRFIHTAILDAKVNTGTSANANRGMFAAQGKWLKIIAGDDLLADHCIEANMNFVQSHPHIQLLFSTQTPFLNTYSEAHRLAEKNHSREYFYSNNLSARKQFLILLFKYTVNSPTMFVSKPLFVAVNGYDEQMKIIEDIAFYMRVLLFGGKMHYLNTNTVFYRVHQHSVSQTISATVSDKKMSDRQLRWITYVKPYTNGLTRVLHNGLMVVYFKKGIIARQIRHGITALSIALIKLNILR